MVAQTHATLDQVLDILAYEADLYLDPVVQDADDRRVVLRFVHERDSRVAYFTLNEHAGYRIRRNSRLILSVWRDQAY